MATPMNLQIIISAIDKATKPTMQMAQKMKGQFEGMRGAGMALAGAGTAITGAFALALNRVADMGDELDKMSARTGASVDFLNQMGFVAERSGSSLGAIEKGFKTLSTQLVTADRATEATLNAFKDLGVDIDDLKNRDPQEVFEEMLKAVAAVPDEMKRAGIASELFGRAGIQLLPIFASGADGMDKLMDRAKALGGEGLKPTADAAAAFEDSITDVGFATKNTLMKAMTPFLKMLTPLITKISNAIAAFGKWAAEHPFLTKVMIAAGVALGGLMLALGALILLAPAILTAFIAMSGALGGMAVGFSAASIGAGILSIAMAPLTLIILAIVAAIIVLIGIGYLLIKNWDSIKETFVGIWESIKEGALAAINPIIQNWGKIKDFFTDLVAMAKNWGKNLMLNLWAGIKEMAMKPVNAIKDMVQGIRDYLPFSEPKKGALRGITKVGGKIHGAISEGLDQNARGFNVSGGGGSKTFAITITTDKQIDGRIETQIGRFVDALRGMA